MSIEYKINEPVTADEFIDVLVKSTLGERRPIEDRKCIEGIISNSNLMATAWEDAQLVGIARSVTDFHYSCYLSDLAVAQSHQCIGVGKNLLSFTQEQLGLKCKLILLAAPEAHAYYETLGFENNPRGWVLNRDATIKS